MIESLMVTVRQHQPSPIFMAEDDIKRMHLARTCYDHLAGKLGVGIKQAMIERGFITCHADGVALMLKGHQWLRDQLGIMLTVSENTPCACLCADWSEQTYHLAGDLGRQLHRAFLHKGYIKTTEHRHYLHITSSGISFLHQQLDMLVSS